MKPRSLPEQFRPPRRSVLALGALFAAGIAAASIVGSSAAAPEDDCVVGLVCPGVTVTTPTLPTVTLPLPTTTTTATTTTTSTSSGTTAVPPASGGGDSQNPAADEPFTYTIVQVSTRRVGPVRWIHMQLSLSKAATVVAILHRQNVPSIVAVRPGREGANKFAVTVPRRVHAGRYTLKLVLGVGVDQYAATRTISIPK